MEAGSGVGFVLQRGDGMLIIVTWAAIGFGAGAVFGFVVGIIAANYPRKIDATLGHFGSTWRKKP